MEDDHSVQMVETVTSRFFALHLVIIFFVYYDFNTHVHILVLLDQQCGVSPGQRRHKTYT